LLQKLLPLFIRPKISKKYVSLDWLKHVALLILEHKTRIIYIMNGVGPYGARHTL